MFCRVPMQPIPNHSFYSVIPIDEQNVTLRFRLTYNEIARYWVVDISRDDEPLITSLPLVPGQNILEQFRYLRIGRAYIVPRSQGDVTPDEQWPTANTLSDGWDVWWGDTDG